MGAPSKPPSAEVLRLSPTMVSRKLLALDFIKRYFARLVGL
jgi:hypothetical protein